MQALNKQIARNPKDYALLQDQAELLYELDSVKAAREAIRAAIDLFRNGADLYYFQGFYAWADGDTLAAKAAYLSSVGLGTEIPEAYYQLGQLYFFQAKWDSALFFYQAAAERDEQAAIYLFAQGYLAETQGNFRKATRIYLESLALDSTLSKAYAQLHNVYLDRYQSEAEAMKYTRLLLARQPRHPLANYQMGNFHLRRALRVNREDRLPEFEQAINDAVVSFSIAVNRDPNFAQAWYNRGYCYWLGEARLDLALQDFQRCIALNPNYAPAHFQVGTIYEFYGDAKQALSYYETAARLNPRDPTFQQARRELRAKLNP